MMPVIFRIPLIDWWVPGYGLVLMLGFLLSVVWAVQRAARSGANPDVVLNCAFIALLGGVGGARFMHVVHYWEQFRYYSSLPDLVWAILDVRKGGLEVYGGLIVAIAGATIYLALWRHSLRWYLDIMAPSAALGMGLGRIGCFLNGCCWGTVSDLPWSVQFPFGSSAMVEQWQAGEPGLDVPEQLIFFPPNGIGPDGRPAYLLSREVTWLSEDDVAEAQRAADAARQEIAATAQKLAKAGGEQERAHWRQQMERLRSVHAPALSRYADVRMAMERYDLSLGELQALARKHRSLPVHPTQLYSVIALVLIAGLLSAVYWRRTRDGQVICTLLLVEPWTRYALELLRADNPVDTLGFTVSQFLAITLSGLGLLGFFLLRLLPPRSPRARLWDPEEEKISGEGKGKRRAAARS